MDFRNKEDMRYSRNQDKTMATQRRNIDQWSVMNNDGQVSFLRPRGGNKGLGFTGSGHRCEAPHIYLPLVIVIYSLLPTIT